MARIQGESVSSVSGSFEQLPTPLAVSGLSRRQAAELQTRLDERGESFHVYRAASATSSAVLDPTQFVPGETLGAAISYGDASYYATGTATFTCGEYVAAFGHPFFYDAPGEISLGLASKPSSWSSSRSVPGYRYAADRASRDGRPGPVRRHRRRRRTGRRRRFPSRRLQNLDDLTSRQGETKAIHTWGGGSRRSSGHTCGATSPRRSVTSAAGPPGSMDAVRAHGRGAFTVSDFSMASSPWDVTDSMWPLRSARSTPCSSTASRTSRSTASTRRAG
jgi:hypothetical protein